MLAGQLSPRRVVDARSLMRSVVTLLRSRGFQLLLIAAPIFPVNLALVLWGSSYTSLALAAYFVFPEIVGAALVLGWFTASTGAQPGILASYQAVLLNLHRLLLASVFHVLVPSVLILTLVGIPWGISLFVRWSFYPQFIMIHGLGSTEALAASANLVQGIWWRVFALAGCIAAMATVVALPTLVFGWANLSAALIFAGSSLVTMALATGTWTTLFLKLAKGSSEFGCAPERTSA